MDGKTFAKLAKDCKIIDKKLTATDIDLIFAKAKKKTERKINFEEFQKAL
jgi:p25-alpha